MGKFVCTTENGNISTWKKQQTLHPAFEDQSLQLWSKDFDLQEFQSVYSAKSILHMTREKFYGCSKSRGWYIWRRLPPFEGLLILRLNPFLLRPGHEFFKRWNPDATVMSPSCPPIALQWRHCCVFASVQRAPSKCRLVSSSCWCACMHLCRVPSKCRWIWTDHEYDHHAGVHVCIHAENQALQVQMNMTTLIVMLVC